MANYYTGIGSRNTPIHILTEMTALATELETHGLILRSGGASGADTAFEAGVKDPHNAKIFLPWHNFNQNTSALYRITADALDMAKKYHPAWHRCSAAARKFHARNCYQILGNNLDTKSQFVLCWTPNGEMVGGTSQALRIAKDLGIPIFNMAETGWSSRFNLFMTDHLLGELS